MKDRLRAGDLILDREFDDLLPAHISQLSSAYWTPIVVAVAAAAFLTEGRPSARLLDVGCGPGKFCAIAAASTGAHCHGVDRSEELVRVARDVAERLGLSTAHFQVGDALRLDWQEFDGFYFYNPFSELIPDITRPSDSVRTSYGYFAHSVRAATEKLYLMPVGTRVVTFHGIGGQLPGSYKLVGHSVVSAGDLRFYVRGAGADADGPASAC